ncbi:MAG: oxidoreductase [Aeromicrobium sp.]|uniref:oxidoreductase n=1 Tax=Aeromicrobium sp. TaxID=1871063 RepID=UPI00261C7FE4|nr:oxidoreductase [Aeromicrobium sp.]MDF1705698.1 oxidoreductase [Aeromicrobium sp.]
MTWTTDDIADLTGRRALITGVTGGLGTQIARELARHGASLVVTARDAAKAEATVASVRAETPGVEIDVVSLDLADLADVRRAAQEVLQRWDRIDLAINNAGIMIPPFRETVDGFELQIATNHLGHFAWNAHLWPLLRDSSARVVAVSSIAHTTVNGIDLRSLTPAGSPRRYKRWQSYGESKLANLLFSQELHRRASAARLGVVSVAAHPGVASTELTKTGFGVGGGGPIGFLMHHGTHLVAQSARAGSLPVLQAATDPSLSGGEYLGPQGFRGMRGRPGPAGMTRTARDPELARLLWEASENATGTPFPVAEG